MVQARDELINVLCRKEMGVYTAIFSSTGDTAVRVWHCLYCCLIRLARSTGIGLSLAAVRH